MSRQLAGYPQWNESYSSPYTMGPSILSKEIDCNNIGLVYNIQADECRYPENKESVTVSQEIGGARNMHVFRRALYTPPK